MYKHLSYVAFKIKLTSASDNAGTCEKLHDRSRIRLRQKAGVCVCVCVCVCKRLYSYSSLRGKLVRKPVSISFCLFCPQYIRTVSLSATEPRLQNIDAL